MNSHLVSISGDSPAQPLSGKSSVTPELARQAMWSCASSVTTKRLLAEDRTIIPANSSNKVDEELRKVWHQIQPWCTKFALALRAHWKLTTFVVDAAAAPPLQVHSSVESENWYRVSLRAKYVKFIKDGTKTVEGRLARGNMLRIRPVLG